jgi:hypothetical protein
MGEFQIRSKTSRARRIELFINANHWEELARQEEHYAHSTRFDGFPYSDAASHLCRASLYRKTAIAMLREARIGVPYCATCGGGHPGHEHRLHGDDAGCKCGSSDCPWCNITEFQNSPIENSPDGSENSSIDLTRPNKAEPVALTRWTGELQLAS